MVLFFNIFIHLEQWQYYNAIYSFSSAFLWSYTIKDAIEICDLMVASKFQVALSSDSLICSIIQTAKLIIFLPQYADFVAFLY